MSTSTPRPVPVISDDEQNFFRKKRFPSHIESQLLPPKSPMKSAPPISRVYRHRNSSTPGALSVSFRQSERKASANIVSPLYKDHEKLYFDQCFTKLSLLGAGCFGEVYKVQSKDDAKLYAVKKSRERFRGDFDRKQRLEEVNKNELLQGHKNCVRFYKAWEECDFLYIQTELCEMSLKEYSESVETVEEAEIWNMIVDLCYGLKHFHDSQFGHMDIKPANLFLGRDGLYKIGDFGLVVELTRDLSDAMDGDAKYLAPELMESNFSKAADIFSLGITLLELACGIELPKSGRLWHTLRNNQLPEEFTQGLSDDLILLIRKLMNRDPMKRPTVDEMLNLPSVVQAKRNRKNESYVEKLLWPFRAFHLFVQMLCTYVYAYTVMPLLRSDKEPQQEMSRQPLSPPIFTFINSHESIIDDTQSSCPSPIVSNKPLAKHNLTVSPALLRQNNKDQRSPLFQKHLFNKDKLMMSSSPTVTPTNCDSPFTDSPPPSVGEKTFRSRLFSNSESDDDDEVQIVPKNLLRSFNTSINTE